MHTQAHAQTLSYIRSRLMNAESAAGMVEERDMLDKSLKNKHLRLARLGVAMHLQDKFRAVVR